MGLSGNGEPERDLDENAPRRDIVTWSEMETAFNLMSTVALVQAGFCQADADVFPERRWKSEVPCRFRAIQPVYNKRYIEHCNPSLPIIA